MPGPRANHFITGRVGRLRAAEGDEKLKISYARVIIIIQQHTHTRHSSTVHTHTYILLL